MQTARAGTELATSSDAEQKIHTTQVVDEEDGTTTQGQREATLIDAEQKAPITQGDPLDEIGTAIHGHQKADAPSIPRVGYKGLINNDQLCYQNATYQCLCNLSGLRDHLDRLPWTQAEIQELRKSLRYFRATGNFLEEVCQTRSSL